MGGRHASEYFGDLRSFGRVLERLGGTRYYGDVVLHGESACGGLAPHRRNRFGGGTDPYEAGVDDGEAHGRLVARSRRLPVGLHAGLEFWLSSLGLSVPTHLSPGRLQAVRPRFQQE